MVSTLTRSGFTERGVGGGVRVQISGARDTPNLTVTKC